ncbi:hypothetical protein PR048_025929, partial [Dryococelus australis]
MRWTDLAGCAQLISVSQHGTAFLPTRLAKMASEVWSSAGMQGRGKQDIPEKTRRTIGAIPTRGNPGGDPAGGRTVVGGSSLATTPPRNSRSRRLHPTSKTSSRDLKRQLNNRGSCWWSCPLAAMTLTRTEMDVVGRTRKQLFASCCYAYAIISVLAPQFLALRWRQSLGGAACRPGVQICCGVCCWRDSALTLTLTLTQPGREGDACEVTAGDRPGKCPSANVPVRVMEVNMERRWNEGVGETGDPRENPPTNGIVRRDSHLRKSGDPAGLDSTFLCTLEPQMFDHWLLPKRVASVTSHRAVSTSYLLPCKSAIGLESSRTCRVVAVQLNRATGYNQQHVAGTNDCTGPGVDTVSSNLSPDVARATADDLVTFACGGSQVVQGLESNEDAGPLSSYYSLLGHPRNGFGPIGNNLRETGPITFNQVEREKCVLTAAEANGKVAPAPTFIVRHEQVSQKGRDITHLCSSQWRNDANSSMVKRDEDGAAPECNGGRKREIPDEIRRPAASPAGFPYPSSRCVTEKQLSRASHSSRVYPASRNGDVLSETRVSRLAPMRGRAAGRMWRRLAVVLFATLGACFMAATCLKAPVMPSVRARRSILEPIVDDYSTRPFYDRADTTFGDRRTLHVVRRFYSTATMSLRSHAYTAIYHQSDRLNVKATANGVTTPARVYTVRSVRTSSVAAYCRAVVVCWLASDWLVTFVALSLLQRRGETAAKLSGNDIIIPCCPVWCKKQSLVILYEIQSSHFTFDKHCARIQNYAAGKGDIVLIRPPPPIPPRYRFLCLKHTNTPRNSAAAFKTYSPRN